MLVYTFSPLVARSLIPFANCHRLSELSLNDVRAYAVSTLQCTARAALYYGRCANAVVSPYTDPLAATVAESLRFIVRGAMSTGSSLLQSSRLPNCHEERAPLPLSENAVIVPAPVVIGLPVHLDDPSLLEVIPIGTLIEE